MRFCWYSLRPDHRSGASTTTGDASSASQRIWTPPRTSIVRVTSTRSERGAEVGLEQDQGRGHGGEPERQGRLAQAELARAA